MTRLIFQLKVFLKKFLKKLKGGYVPKKFWDGWAESFIKDDWQVQEHAQHSWILKNVKKENPEKILEIGCGFGRNLKFLIRNGISPENLTGVDISKKMIKLAKSHVANSKVKVLVADAQELPFEDKYFDLVLIHGLFMHVAPKNIKSAVNEAIRVAKKTIINIEQNYLPEKSDRSRNYTFIHDYKKLYSEKGMQIKEFIHDKKQGLDYLYVKVR